MHKLWQEIQFYFSTLLGDCINQIINQVSERTLKTTL